MSVTTESSIDPLNIDSGNCFHCGLPVPRGSHYEVDIEGVTRPMCCPGCQAVAQAIVAGGMTDFYRYRTEMSRTPQSLVPDALLDLQLYDRPELQDSFVESAGEHVQEASLILENIVCAACVWLSEQHVNALPGVLEFRVNYSTHRARVKWDDRVTTLSTILKAIGEIGYVAHPFDAGRQEKIQKEERRTFLRRIAVAAVGATQVMMMAVALYAGDYEGMEVELQSFLRWVSLLLTLPVVLYSAQPFFQGAKRDLQRRQLGMDVPVALAIGGAFLASAWATMQGLEEVYFDSVCMFTLFLLTGRFLEMGARHRAGQAAEELVRLLPATATRIEDGVEERVPVADLAPGDRVLIRPGETIPADGVVLEGNSAVDEALLTGESLPQARGPGDELVGGAVNVESPLQMRVEKVGGETVLASITRLLDRAQTEKPAVAQMADRVAAWFVGVLLLLATGVAWYWWQQDPAEAFRITLSVLVVTCPCALSLATPAAITAATGSLTRLGVLTTRGHALETLAQVTHILFDKTGTLTEGRLQLTQIQPLGELDAHTCQRLAAAVEAGSEHPVAHALRQGLQGLAVSSEVQAVPGQGIEAVVQGQRLRVGTLEFAAALCPEPCALPEPAQWVHQSWVVLASEQGLLARFVFDDRPRAGAQEALEGLRALGIQVQLLSGDREGPVRELAQQLGIAHYQAAARPQDKLAAIQALQARGATVAMVGDGVNDAPVLAGAAVSLAMGSGTQLAHASADMVLLSEQLPHLVDAVVMARRTRSVIRQNLSWALVYNLMALPLAMMGWVAPWMAAIGMSGSSLLVVLNALRLRNERQR